MYFWPIMACISHLGKSSFRNIERNLPEERNRVRGHPPLINDVILQFWRHNGPMSIWTSSGFSSSVILLEHSCHYFSAVMKESGEIGAQDQKLSWNGCYFFLEATIHFPDFKQFFTLCLKCSTSKMSRFDTAAAHYGSVHSLRSCGVILSERLRSPSLYAWDPKY